MFTRIIDRFRRLVERVGRSLASFGAAVVRPIERLFHYVGQGLVVGAERLENVEGFLAGPLRLLTFPFRVAFRFISWLLSILVPQRLRDAVGNLLSSLGHGLFRCIELLNLDGAVLWLVWLLKPLWLPFAALFQFLSAWVLTRRWRDFLWGLPAALLIMMIVAATSWWFVRGKNVAAAQYQIAARNALKAKEFDEMQQYELKLVQLGVDTDYSDYQIALGLAKGDRLAEAYERMLRLAPVEKPGYPPAHFWIVQHLLANSLDVPMDEGIRLAGIHLDHLDALGIKGPEIELVRAHWLILRGDLDEASKLLKPLVHRYPLAAFTRLQVDIAMNRQIDAKLDATAVREHVQTIIRQGSPMESGDYQWWAIAEEVLGNNARIRDVLAAWLKQDPTNESARRDLAAINLREFNDMLGQPDPDPVQLAARIREAFEISEASYEIKQQLAILYVQRASRPALQSALDALVGEQDLPASLAEALGTAAALGSEWNHAERCLRRALQLEPKNAVAWNNLACVLNQRPNPDLEEALVAVNKALEMMPEEFRFRETRGQILLKLRRWQEAIDDLEFALNGMPDVTAIHASLAKAYEALGNKQLASVHQQYAN